MIPIKNDIKMNDIAMEKVRYDKEREARDGHDGTWVAHPGLIPIALRAFDEAMPTANQIHRKLEDIVITSRDLLAFGPDKPITEAGMRLNVNVALQYLGSWLGGIGCVPVFNLMEDTATAEICRSQIWQWVRSPKGVLEDGRKVTVGIFRKMLEEELLKVREILGDEAFSSRPYGKAGEFLDHLVTDDGFTDFLTLPAYELI